MGEKRAYKPRKPGGGRRKSKPEYDAEKILKELMDSAVVLYDAGMSLQAIADELGLNPIKVRKLLITAGVYVSDMAEKVQVTFDDFRKTQDHKAAVLSTANALQLQMLLACPGPLLLHIFRTKRVCIFQVQHRQIRSVLEPSGSGGTER